MTVHTMPGRARSSADSSLPLLVTADSRLLDDLLRLASAAGVEVEVAADPAAARAAWRAAPLVVVGADLATGVARARLPRRTEVVVVAGPDPDGAEDPAARLAPSLTPLGTGHVVVLPDGEAWLVGRLAATRHARPPGRVIAVLGGRGGAGASVLAAGLAVTAAGTGRRVLLVDADPFGGGLDLALGWEDDAGVRWPELTGSSGRLDPERLVTALPGRGDLAAVSFDRRELTTVPPTVMEAVLTAGRAARELVVVDVARQVDPAGAAALAVADEGLVVVPAEVRAVTAAATVVAAAGAHCGQLRLVVRGPSPGRLSPTEVGRVLQLPVAGTLRPEVGLPATVEGGLAPTATGRGPLAALCRRLVGELCPPAAAPRVAA